MQLDMNNVNIAIDDWSLNFLIFLLKFVNHFFFAKKKLI